jgi:hypothetical protein
MVRDLAFALLLSVALATPMQAQATPDWKPPYKSELFVGYSYLFRDYRHTQLNPVSGGMNGWNLAFTKPELLNRHIGLTADFSGHYGTGGPFTPQLYFVTAGPRYSTLLGHSTVSVHVLGGALLASGDVIAQTSSQITPLVAVGGGLDHPVGHHLAWQFNLDWLYGGFKTNDTNQITDIVNNNFRFSTGPALHF